MVLLLRGKYGTLRGAHAAVAVLKHSDEMEAARRAAARLLPAVPVAGSSTGASDGSKLARFVPEKSLLERYTKDGVGYGFVGWMQQNCDNWRPGTTESAPKSPSSASISPALADSRSAAPNRSKQARKEPGWSDSDGDSPEGSGDADEGQDKVAQGFTASSKRSGGGMARGGLGSSSGTFEVEAPYVAARRLEKVALIAESLDPAAIADYKRCGRRGALLACARLVVHYDVAAEPGLLTVSAQLRNAVQCSDGHRPRRNASAAEARVAQGTQFGLLRGLRIGSDPTRSRADSRFVP